MRWPKRGREQGTLLALVILCGALWASTPHFATATNFANVAEQTTIIGTLAVGMTFVILTGGIDLSAGSLVAVCGIVLGLAAHRGIPTALVVVATLAIGMVGGALNGAMITIGKLPPFIATLGMMSVARGAALLMSGGRPVSGFGESMRAVSVMRIVGVPAAVLLMLAIYAAAHVVLTRTVFGRYVYAIGGNEEASRFAGVPVLLYKWGVYVVSGLACAITSIVLVARLDSAQPTAGTSYELDAIAAVVVGGTSLLGGAGSVLGTLIGALIMSVLRNGLNLLDVSAYVQQVAIGIVIVLAVLIDMTLRRRRTT